VRLALLADEDSFSRQLTDVAACPPVCEAIRLADGVVFGFGSFYTSILPHLLVDGIVPALAAREMPRVFLCNPTADRETEALTAADLVRILDFQASGFLAAAGARFLTHVVHFHAPGDYAIPVGDLSAFTSSGGRLVNAGEFASFDDVARLATDRLLLL